MPFYMTDRIQAVVIGDNVYVGGGYTLFTKNVGIVMVYAVHTGSWRTLPRYGNHFFGMATVNDYNRLVLVGGRSILTKKAVSVLGVWDEKSRTWTHPFPEMPTSRCSSSVVSYQKWLVVAGGADEIGSFSNKVELLDTLSGQWYEGSSLPGGYSEMSSAIIENMWYLSEGRPPQGASKHVLCVCLDGLISQAVSQSADATASPSTPAPWQTLTYPPLIYSTVLVLNGALLAVGGHRSSSIHLYQPSSRSWVKVGDLPTVRRQCTCIVLPSGEIFIAGGGHGPDNERVDIGHLMTL